MEDPHIRTRSNTTERLVSPERCVQLTGAARSVEVVAYENLARARVDGLSTSSPCRNE